MTHNPRGRGTAAVLQRFATAVHPHKIWMNIHTGWGPPVISWFINHVLIPINYSYIYHKPLLSHL